MKSFFRQLPFFWVCLCVAGLTKGQDYVDLRTWSTYGEANSGKWSVNTDGRSVYQSVNGLPTAFMSPNKFSYRTFRGVIRVDSQRDDDWIGFILGDVNGEMYIFDWKKEDQAGHKKGYMLIRVEGGFATLDEMGWGFHKNTHAKVRNLAVNHSASGWQYGRDYIFEMQVYPDRIVTKIDGQKIFDVNGLNMKPSQFGFFNMSQAGVRYSSIKQLYPPVADDKTASVSQGNVATVQGSWIDQNTDDTHTCTISQTPSRGRVTLSPPCTLTYHPDPDHDGRFSFKYRVTDGSNLYTDGSVAIDVYANGAAPRLPHIVTAGVTTSIPLNRKALNQAPFLPPSINIINQPSFLFVDEPNDRLVLTPKLSDIGLHRNLVLNTVSRRRDRQRIGRMDIKVIPPPIDPQGDNDLVVPTTTKLITTSSGKAVAELRLPLLQTQEGNVATGPHTVRLSMGGTVPVVINGQTVHPNETVETVVDLQMAGTRIPVSYVSSVEAVTPFRLEFPWLNSPNDFRYVTQRVCHRLDSSRCEPHLEMDRQVAPSGNVQVIFRRKIGQMYKTYGFDGRRWDDLFQWVAAMRSGDVLAINIHNESTHLDHFFDELSKSLSSSDMTTIRNATRQRGAVVYVAGLGVVSSEGGAPYRWGNQAVTWIALP